MHFGELKEVIKHLKKVMPCNSCGKKFVNEGIRILSTCNKEALFHFGCFTCANKLIVHVTILEQGENRSRLNIQMKNTKKITSNDILDIHNFLTRFDGDFKDLFSTEKN